ncbi:hypothetical protein INR49_018526 [Caranx melampygus]|nr:hypothetical protein INR49_018526 [Caranx melampygus]
MLTVDLIPTDLRDVNSQVHVVHIAGQREISWFIHDLTRSSLAELLLSDLLQPENEALEEENFPLAEGEPEDVHIDLERAAVGTGPLLAPRERKAGCKNFFWKTFTSC